MIKSIIYLINGYDLLFIRDLIISNFVALENISSRGLLILFGLIVTGIAVIFSTVIFPITNLIRETVITDGVVVSNSNGECIVDTPDNIPKVIKNCDLQAGSKVTVSFLEEMYKAKIVSQP